jgi:NAD(P)-dependent dehydrogenase (short-subunit alcohol dehydrogenase family)
MSIALVTGANRGIGLELCRQLSERGVTVLAACRQSSPELDALGVQVLEGCEVTDELAVEQLARTLKGVDLDLLLLNAGILTRESLDDLDLEAVRRQFEVNTLGPLRVARALRGNLSAGAKVGVLTSLMGSLEDNGSGGYYGYRISKAGVNVVGVNLAHDLRPQGVAVALLHPGMVATAMTSGRGISTAESVSGLLARLDELSLETSGGFWHQDGRELPW